MSRIAYVNGDFVAIEEARISVLDRGFLFADGVYEVTAVIDGRLVDNEAHLARLGRSLSELSLSAPVSMDDLTELQLKLGRRNGLTEGLIYYQITRGAGEIRDFAFPQQATPSLVMFTQEKAIVDAPMARTGARVVTFPDLRWKRRDIKSVALLAQVMAKQAAVEKGCFEAFMVEDGEVTEASSSSAFIVTPGGTIVARPLSNDILAGVTRKAVLRLAAEQGLTIEERRFGVEELHGAAEVFVTSASSMVMPVVEVDGETIADGRPGSVTLRLRELYVELARACEPRIAN